jgi:myo-inositol catabolism protein IolC
LNSKLEPHMSEQRRRASHADPLLILAMDHRESFGRSLFGVVDDQPTETQRAAMEASKMLIYSGLTLAGADLAVGHAGVLVDERYGQRVIRAARASGVVLAVPIERSGRDWFELEWGKDWVEHLRRAAPDYAKVLVRDNPDFATPQRDAQLAHLSRVSETLNDEGIRLIYELLVPATREQLAGAGGDGAAYDREVRPGLTIQVIAENQRAGVEPAIWKVEGLEDAAAARAIVAQARDGGRAHVDAIVLGRDAPAERLNHWLDVAAPIDGFVGFAIGRSIWEDTIRAHIAGSLEDAGCGPPDRRALPGIRTPLGRGGRERPVTIWSRGRRAALTRAAPPVAAILSG